MLDRYLKVEVLDGKNQYDCTHCGLQNGSRKFSVACAPPCLVLTLSCFKYNPATGTRSKLLADVAPPLVLNLPVLHRAQKDSLDDSQGGTLREDSVLKKYHLKAVVVHRGASPNSGHYYTYGCTRHDAAEWCVFNDDIVQPAAQDVLLTSAKVTKLLWHLSKLTIVHPTAKRTYVGEHRQQVPQCHQHHQDIQDIHILMRMKVRKGHLASDLVYHT
eukprot:m.759348 g.759348  ORF g.759348 m.759348 type:complete len:216 (+) comp23195_c0_seq5:2402-3049(+)